MAPPKLKGLGRGLDALLAANNDSDTIGGDLQLLPASEMQAGKYQPRTRMDPGSLEELAAYFGAPLLLRLRNGNFVKQPQVTLVVLQVRGNQASVLGMVNRPGRYPLEVADMRLTDLLAIAGGTAVNGSDSVVVTGTRDGKPFRLEVDVPSVFVPGGAAKDVQIKNGDAIWVDRQPLAYIYGEVQRPGPMRVERGMTVMQVLATGGGLTVRGTQKGIRLHRKSSDGKVNVTEPSMDDKVQDGDVVFVKESLF